MINIRTRFTLYELWEKVAYLTIAAFVLYSFWFQQVYYPIAGALTFFGVVFLILIAMNLKRISYYKELHPVFIFIIIVVLETFTFARFKQSSMQMLLTCLEYLLPAIMIFLYVDGKKDKLDRVLIVILMAVTLLSVGSFINPARGNTGSISVGTLNVNVFSSFLLLGLISACVLYFREKKKCCSFFPLSRINTD